MPVRYLVGRALQWVGLVWLALAFVAGVVGAWLTGQMPSLGDGLLLLAGFGWLALARRFMA